MSDTPRTDAKVTLRHEGTPLLEEFVRADFARQLERENAKLLRALEQYRGQIDCNGRHSASDVIDSVKESGK